MKFKKLSAIALSLTLMTGFVPTQNSIFEKASIQTNAIAEFGDFLYSTKDNEVSISPRTKSVTSAVIPDEINGMPVTSIASNAFSSCYKLASVTFPSTLRTIGSISFYQCDALTSLTFPASLKEIGGAAFYDCSALETVNFNYGLTTIESDAFAYCYKLKDIVLPETVSTIGAQAFQNDINIKKITIANPNCSIADDARTFPGGAVICAPAGSTAEAYAKKYSRSFEAINAPQTTETTTPVVTTTTTILTTTTSTSTSTTTTTPETTSTTSETTTTTTPETTSTTSETTTTTTLDTTSTTSETTTTTTPETTSTTSETTTTTTPETTSTTSETTTTTTLETTTTTPVQKGMQGDANCDGKIDIADVVSVKCYLLNSVKYELSDIGKVNADVQGSGNGLNLNDVVMIQKYCLKLIDSFEA